MADGKPAPDPIKLTFRPGINRETTNSGNTGGWYDCNLVRWRSGTPESMSGWQRFTSEPAEGTWRSLFPFTTLSNQTLYSGGTEIKYYIIRGSQLVDITPLRATASLTNPFTTALAAVATTTHTITVTDVDHGCDVGDRVTFDLASTAGTLGGIALADFEGEFVVVDVIDADTYTFTLTTSSAITTTVATGGGSVTAEYQINIGYDTAQNGDGWGTGVWGGAVGWGQGTGDPVTTEGIRLWMEDSFGEDIIFNIYNGGIYFKATASISGRGVTLRSTADASIQSYVPVIATQMLVSDNSRHVIAFGCNPLDSDVQDPLLIRWSTSEDKTVWYPDTTNSAGELRIGVGSNILRAVETTTETLVFTDVSLHSLKYVGPPYTFGETRIGSNIHLIGPNAVASTGSVTFWMANGVFQMYDGTIRDMPSGIRQYIFSILNFAQVQKIYAGIDRQFKEVIWHMPVNGSSECNFYAVCNYEDPNNLIWYYGSYNDVGRTTWLDAWYEDNPLAASPDGYIYRHDFGATDGSDGSAISAYLTSSVFEIGNGMDFMLVSRVIPDVNFYGSVLPPNTNPRILFEFNKRDYPGSAFSAGPDPTVTRTSSGTILMPVETYTAKLDRRFRARSVDMTISTDTTVPGTSWQLGVPRLYASPDGQR
jgi:hypothetical protein